MLALLVPCHSPSLQRKWKEVQGRGVRETTRQLRTCTALTLGTPNCLQLHLQEGPICGHLHAGVHANTQLNTDKHETKKKKMKEEIQSLLKPFIL